MSHPDKQKVIDLVNCWLGRSALTIDQVLARMQARGCDVSRSSFENQFTTRVGRPPNAPPEWVLALTAAFTERLPNGERATAAEAIELARLARLPIDQFKKLSDYFPAGEFAAAYADYAPLPELTPFDPLAQPVQGRCPYRGLQPFEESHAQFFFGRESEVAWMMSALEHSRFLAVIGPSGSGKSSLIRAGLLPALRRNRPLLIQTLEPGQHPLLALASVLTTGQERQVTGLAERLGTGKQSFDQLAQALLAHYPDFSHLVLVVDQFEELFTLCQNERTRQAFIVNLLQATTRPAGQTSVILTMRADFYGQAAVYPNLAHHLSRHQLLLSPLSGDQLMQAITAPARLAGLQFEPGLVERLLADAAGEPGTLPLLQHALLELWERRQSRRLTLAAYQASGGVHGALAQRADRLMAEFSPEQQEILRRVMLRLTRLGEGTAATRRRATLTELSRSPAEESMVRKIVARLADARLLTTSFNRETGEEMVDVAHEALIRGWPALQSWLAEDREALRFHQQLTAAAAEWNRYDGETSYLYRGVRLAQAQEWAATYGDELNELEKSFLQASVAAQESAEKAAQRSRRYVLVGLTAALVVVTFLLMLSLILGRTALVRQREADQQRRLAEAGAVAAQARSFLQSNPPLATLLALAAQTVAETDEANQVIARAPYNYPPLEATLSGHTDFITDVVFSPDGQWLASGGKDGLTILWDLDTGRPITTFTAQSGEVESLCFSPSGQQLASIQTDGFVTIWDATNVQVVTEFRIDIFGPVTSIDFSPSGQKLAIGSGGQAVIWDPAAGDTQVEQVIWQPIMSLAYSPDGHWLALGSFEGEVLLWDRDRRQIKTTLKGHTNTVSGLSYSPDGRYLASSSWDNTTIIWNLAREEPLVTLRHPNQVYSVAFSPDGQRLATGAYGGNLTIWDAASGEVLSRLNGHTGQIWSVAFSPDGRQLASSAGDEMIMIWDVAGPPMVKELRGHSGLVTGLAFSPDGRWLATGSRDRTVIAWDVANGQVFTTFREHTHRISDIAFSPDGHRLVSQAGNGKTLIWEVDSKEIVTSFQAEAGRITSVAFGPDGDKVASGLIDGRIIMWDPRTGQPTKTVEGHTDVVGEVAFSPDGRLLASGSNNGYVAIWNFAKKYWLAGQFDEPKHSGGVTGLDFSPDGQLLASSGDQTILIYDVANRGILTRLEGHRNIVWDVAFSPDGQKLASGSADAIYIWDVATGQIITRLNGHDGVPSRVAFSPDGRWLASGAEEQVLMLDTTFTQPPCEWLTRNLSRREWERYLPTSLPYRELCPGLPVPGG